MLRRNTLSKQVVMNLTQASVKRYDLSAGFEREQRLHSQQDQHSTTGLHNAMGTRSVSQIQLLAGVDRAHLFLKLLSPTYSNAGVLVLAEYKHLRPDQPCTCNAHVTAGGATVDVLAEATCACSGCECAIVSDHLGSDTSTC